MEKLTAPKLPEGYRFKVTTAGDPSFNRVALERKGWMFWNEVDTGWARPYKEEVHSQMNKLLDRLGVPTSKFNGYYPPREEL